MSGVTLGVENKGTFRYEPQKQYYFCTRRPQESGCGCTYC